MESTYRFDIHKRRRKLQDFLENGGPQNPNNTLGEPEASAENDSSESMNEEIYRDKKSSFAAKFIFTDQVSALSNRQKHQVDYFVSCPCSSADFSSTAHFSEVGNKGMGEYING